MKDISKLKYPNRVEIFRDIATDDSDCINPNIMRCITGDDYHSFIDFCEKVFSEKDKIASISCSIRKNKLHCKIEYKPVE